MELVFMDFETFYDKEYSLRKMTPIEYILDQRFEALGVAVKYGLAGKSKWVGWQDIPKLIAELRDRNERNQIAIVSHNSLFDAAILAWRYGFVPTRLIDTLGMARAMVGYRLKSLALDSVSQHLGFGAKWGTLQKMVGVGRRQLALNGALATELGQYGCDDNDKCASIFKTLIVDFPLDELEVMDLVIKATVLPQFKLDRQVLADHLAKVQQQKRDMLSRADVIDAGALRSNEKFAELLRQLGVDPPMKTSITNPELKIYAFAKTDSAFIDLAEHDDPAVQALVAARLGHRSTLEETRSQRLISIGNLTWPVGDRWMPVPLRFSGAHTHRLSGDMKLNMQNLPRKGGLRDALVAPAGFQVVSIDMSQIEARIVAWICEQLDLLEAFALGIDVYSEFGTEVFGMEVSKTINPNLRFLSKTAILGLGYGMSAPRYVISVKSGSKNQLGYVIEITLDTGIKVVDGYRGKYRRIPATWRTLDGTGIPTLARGGTYVVGACVFTKGEIRLPNGLKLFYDDLEMTSDGWRFRYGGRYKFAYGAKVLENMTQALAQIIIKDLARRAHSNGLRFAHQVHDELIFVVKNKLVGKTCERLLELAAIRPDWAPELPLASEVKAGKSYGEMKPLL